MTVGRILLVGGVLVLLFIPYLLWGTGLITAQSQDQLRQEFATAQRQVKQGAPPGTTVMPTTATSPPTLAPAKPDPPVGSPVGIIVIPKIGLSMMVVEGIGTAQLQQGPGHYPGTPMPGQAGNAAIAGHRTTYLHPFYSLDALVPGDTIKVSTLQGLFIYHVLGSQAVSPTDVAVVGPTATPQLTLTTCNPRYSARQRLIVHAALVASTLVHSTTSTALQPVPVAAPIDPPARSWPLAIAWGLFVAALITGVWFAGHRTRAAVRVSVIVGGLLVWLVVVFFFFQALAPLLPASF
jgi:sortase A